MARTSARVVSNDFGLGLVSEASPLNFPEGALVSALNMIPGKPGEKRRRPGLQLEDNRVLMTNNPAGAINHAYSNYQWDSVGSDPDFNLLVVQWGRELLFFIRDAPDNTLTPNQQVGTNVRSIDLRAFTSNRATPLQVQENKVSLADGNGELFVAGKYIYPFRVTWDGTDFVVRVVHPIVRDFRLVPDGLSIGERPASLSTEHQYNLNNQGWNDARITAFQTTSTGNLYPSNADIYYEGLKTDPSTGNEVFAAAQIEALGFGNSRAPSGHYLYDAQYPEYSWADINEVEIQAVARADGSDVIVVFLKTPLTLSPGDRVYIKNVAVRMSTDTVLNSAARLSGVYEVKTAVSTLEFTIEQLATQDAFTTDFNYVNGGKVIGPLRSRPGTVGEMFSPDAVGFFSGRLWLGNVTTDQPGGVSREFQTGIYFTELVENEDSYEKFHQAGDPTAQFRNALVPTDGGVIPVAEIGLCTQLLKIGNHLLACSGKGVWGIAGQDNVRFNADSYELSEITRVGLVSKASAVKVEDIIFYWSDEGIYAVNVDRSAIRPVARSVSDESIKDFYNDIPDAEKAAATGVYDKATKQVWWLYGLNGLVLDAKPLAWLPVAFNVSNEARPVGFAALKGTAGGEQRIKVATSYTLAPVEYITFADMADRTFEDWRGLPGGGVDAAGHMETYYVTLGQPSLKKDVIAVSTFMRRTEENWILSGAGGLIPDFPSGCKVQVRFSWADEAVDGGFAKKFQAYQHQRVVGPPAAGVGPFSNGKQVIVTKERVNGSGDAVNMRFETEAGKDCRLYGYSLFLGADTDESSP